MSNELQTPPSESEGQDVPPPKPQLGKLTIWRRIVQRYRWMSLWNRIALWAFVVLVICTVAGFQYVRPAYRHFKSRMALKMANEAAAAGDYNSASLSFRKAIMSGNTDPFVWKNVAVFLEKIKSPELGKIWETLAELEPDVPEHKIRQAEVMLDQGRTFQASEILDKLPESAKEGVGFRRVSAKLALSRRDYKTAGEQLEAWSLIEPDNIEVKFRLLVTQMYSNDPLVAYPAKDQIEQIAYSRGPASAQSYRELVARSMQEGDIYDAARLAGRLADLPNPTFDDIATFLNLEIASKSFALQIALDRFLDFAEANPDQLPKVVNFLLERGQTDAVSNWMQRLPASVIEHPDVQFTRFQVALSTKDWNTAFSLLRDNKLPIKVQPEIVDLAERAFAEREAGDKTADQTWQQMLYASQGNGGALQLFSLMAEARNWPLALGRTLVALTNLASGNLEIWRRLAKHEVITGNLAGYHSALTGMMRVNPYDIGVSSDWAISSVLLRKEDPNVVVETALRAYESTYPANPSVATSYALALLGVNRRDEAIAVIEQMTLSDRMAPERAIYVGAVLASVGRNEEALTFLQRAEDAGSFRFIEELGFRRIWKGIAMGEESAEDQLKKIFEERLGWQSDAEQIAFDMRREIDLRYDPVQSQRILDDLRRQTEQRQTPPAELQKLIQDLKVDCQSPGQ
jgi:predicted Zn-dependent protease